MNKAITVIFLIFLFCSCQESSNGVTAYNDAITSFVVDKDKNYNQVLTEALGLDENQEKKVKNILTSYRSNRKKKPEREEKLRSLREKKLAKILSPVQMKQRKFINSLYYGPIPKYPTHPGNIKSKYALSDGQVLKLIEIEELQKTEKDKVLRKKRLEKILGTKVAGQYMEGNSIVI